MTRQIKRSEIYYADLSPVVGSEQGGIRPVIIIQNDIGNAHSPTTIIAPLTSKMTKAKLPTHVTVKLDDLPRQSIVLCEQVRVIDKSRLRDYLCTAPLETMVKIDRAIIASLGLE